jgi:hypothetical protein
MRDEERPLLQRTSEEIERPRIGNGEGYFDAWREGECSPVNPHRELPVYSTIYKYAILSSVLYAVMGQIVNGKKADNGSL